MLAAPVSLRVLQRRNFSPSHATQTALWMPWNALLPSIDNFAADGNQSVQSFLAWLPL
jgi:hypothetical protein